MLASDYSLYLKGRGLLTSRLEFTALRHLSKTRWYKRKTAPTVGFSTVRQYVSCLFYSISIQFPRVCTVHMLKAVRSCQAGWATPNHRLNSGSCLTTKHIIQPLNPLKHQDFLSNLSTQTLALDPHPERGGNSSSVL